MLNFPYPASLTASSKLTGCTSKTEKKMIKEVTVRIMQVSKKPVFVSFLIFEIYKNINTRRSIFFSFQSRLPIKVKRSSWEFMLCAKRFLIANWLVLLRFCNWFFLKGDKSVHNQEKHISQTLTDIWINCLIVAHELHSALNSNLKYFYYSCMISPVKAFTYGWS